MQRERKTKRRHLAHARMLTVVRVGRYVATALRLACHPFCEFRVVVLFVQAATTGSSPARRTSNALESFI
eukprot:10532220-Prorocentrum_lima.AAC.1